MGSALPSPHSAFVCGGEVAAHLGWDSSHVQLASGCARHVPVGLGDEARLGAGALLPCLSALCLLGGDFLYSLIFYPLTKLMSLLWKTGCCG